MFDGRVWCGVEVGAGWPGEPDVVLENGAGFFGGDLTHGGLKSVAATVKGDPSRGAGGADPGAGAVGGHQPPSTVTLDHARGAVLTAIRSPSGVPPPHGLTGRVPPIDGDATASNPRHPDPRPR